MHYATWFVKAFFLSVIFLPGGLLAQSPGDSIADKPLYHDPVYDGAADPALIWNQEAHKWWMFYTNRRATDTNATGVSWVHGTRIGIAESTDGVHWNYVDTANINYRPDSGYTYWAPALVEDKGLYHMFLTYVPGIFNDWNHPRYIIHLTSRNLMNWKYESKLKLAGDKVIDPYVVRLPGGTWRLFYNNEKDHKSIYYADSKDLYHWTDKGVVVNDMAGEGPIAFSWKGRDWLIVDNWKGFGVYQSMDWQHWNRQDERLVEKPGTGRGDGRKGDHGDVVVSQGRAYLFYFVQAGRRSWIQVAELKMKPDGTLGCDRNAPTYIHLTPPG